MRHLAELLGVLSIAALPLFAQMSSASVPRPVTYCELSKDPASYNHQVVRLTAFVTHGFEDFRLAEPTCRTQGFSVWVMYGGKVESNTAYCCPGEAGRETRPSTLKVEGLQIPLLEDATFQRFRDLLGKEKDTTVRVTVVGTFFSGEKQTVNGSTFWGGAGHLGCCSLFVIQRLESFEPHTRSDVDYTAEAGWYEKEGCKSSSVQYRRYVSITEPDGAVEQAIAEQGTADNGRTWAFDDPQRVAVETLKSLYPGQIPTLRRVNTSPVRQVFGWRSGTKSIVVVVIRPYWLSLYAASGSVAWVSTAVKEAECR